MREEAPDDLLTIGDFAAMADVPAETLRFYGVVFQPPSGGLMPMRDDRPN